MKCKYATVCGEDKNSSVVCSIIVESVGMRCGMPLKACERCKYAEGDNSFIHKMAKGHICNLLISGNQPRFADVVDVPAMAARFMPISTKEEREEVIRKAVECQCIPQEKGGHDAATIEKNLRELERELGLKEILGRAL